MRGHEIRMSMARARVRSEGGRRECLVRATHLKTTRALRGHGRRMNMARARVEGQRGVRDCLVRITWWRRQWLTEQWRQQCDWRRWGS